MRVPAVYLPEAQEDIAASHIYHEREQAGLGNQFVEALRETMDRIRDNPQLYGMFRHDIRAAPVKSFPYVVFYRDRGSDILVIAVQHGRRSSRTWWGRSK